MNLGIPLDSQLLFIEYVEAVAMRPLQRYILRTNYTSFCIGKPYTHALVISQLSY